VLAEAEELLLVDPAQGERFYGNRVVAGVGTYMPPDPWGARVDVTAVPAKTQIVVGFDGSDVDDWTGFRCQTKDGYQFTPQFGPGRPMAWNPAEHGGQVPRAEVDAAMDLIMSTWNVARAYCDPPYWESDIDRWAEKYGEKVVIGWYTRRVTQMHAAAERLLTDVMKLDSHLKHDGCEITQKHITAAVKSPRVQGRYVLAKPGDGRKIDMAIPSILANEAWGDVTKVGWPVINGESLVYFI
jgi:hypothetical protein